MLWPNGIRTQPTISSPFGPRVGGAFGTHYGTDFIGFTDVKAIAGGKVTFAGWANDAAGNTVIVSLGGGVEILYMHLASVAVSRGATIAEGQNVGVMGKTGNATGKCVHIEVRVKGTSVDPVPWIADQLSAAPAFPLPAGSYFGPRFPLSNRSSVSGFYSHRGDLMRWQQRMKDRGWPIDPDGLYGDQTGDVTEAFQREKGLVPDRRIGPATWRAAWDLPVT